MTDEDGYKSRPRVLHTHTHTLAEFHICAHTRYGKREREGERVYGKDKRTKRVRTMYTRYDSMTYYGQGGGKQETERTPQGRKQNLVCPRHKCYVCFYFAIRHIFYLQS